MADATFASRSTQASAKRLMLIPACSARGLSCCTARRTSGFITSDIKPPIESLVARLFDGGGEFGAYLPDNTPCAKGDQTICEMPCARHSGMTFFSGARHNIEYCGWLDTKRSTRGMEIASSMFCGDHSLNPK